MAAALHQSAASRGPERRARFAVPTIIAVRPPPPTAAASHRFRGCPHRSLRVLLLDGAQADAAAASIRCAADAAAALACCTPLSAGTRSEAGAIAPTAPPPSTALLCRSDGALPTGAHALDFDRTFDRASDSWTLAVALPAGAPRPARLDLLCHACRAGDERLSGLLASRPLGGAQQGGSVVAVVLDGATLPADAPFAGGGASRRLQAADCSLTVAGKAYSFDTCADVKHPNLSNGLSLKVCPLRLPAAWPLLHALLGRGPWRGRGTAAGGGPVWAVAPHESQHVRPTLPPLCLLPEGLCDGGGGGRRLAAAHGAVGPRQPGARQHGHRRLGQVCAARALWRREGLSGQCGWVGRSGCAAF